MASRSKKQRSLTIRHILIASFFVLWMGVIVWRLAYLQLTSSDSYAQQAARQHTDVETTLGFRGEIVDRNGQPLARTIQLDTVHLDVLQIEEKAKANAEKQRKKLKLDDTQYAQEITKLTEQLKAQCVQALAPILRTSESELLKTVNSGHKFPLLAAKLDIEASNNVRTLADTKGYSYLRVERETQREYPNGNIGVHILGFLNAAKQGVTGLEKYLNDFLQGQQGEVTYERDALGHPFARVEKDALAGARIVTTIDVNLQHKLEMELARTVSETKAINAYAVIMDPRTGEILALATAPTYDPTKRMAKGEEVLRRNRAISDFYEPGSVFKIVTYAAGIEEGVIHPNDKIFCGNGQIQIGSRTIHDAHPYGELTIAEALAKSSNVAAIKVAQKVEQANPGAFSRYVDLFGFGHKTGIDLPAESPGMISKQQSQGALASMAMGHQIGVTALQAVTAMATIANDGTWIQPHVVKKVVTGDAGQRILQEPKPNTKRVISEQTAQTMKEMLKGVVDKGTARHTVQLAGYTAAGKTGTAQKVIDGKYYSDTDYIASFAGFVPVADPRFAIIVVLDNPQGPHQGGMVAAPIFSKIAQAALTDYGVLPDAPGHKEKIAELEDKYRQTPKEWNFPEAAPVKAIAASSPSPKASMKPTPAAMPTPQAKEKPTPKPTPVLQLPQAKAAAKPVTTPKPVAVTKPSPQEKPKAATGGGPNVIGRGLREVASLCSQAGLKLKAIGSGIAKNQRRSGDTLIVEFK